MSVIACRETNPAEKGQRRTTCLPWVTNFKVKAKNVLDLANHEERTRWKEENEGFNVQKDGDFALEHAFSQNDIADKVFYFFLQIEHLLAQPMEKGSLLRQAFPHGVGSVKNKVVF